MFSLTFSRKWSGTTVFKCWRNGAVKVRENGWQKRAACFAKAMFCVLPATFKPVASCEKLLQKEGSSSTFCNKICTCCTFYRPKANFFCSKLRDSRVWRDSRVILSNKKSVLAQHAATFTCFKTGLNGGVKKRNIPFQHVLRQFCKKSSTLLFPVLL